MKKLLILAMALLATITIVAQNTARDIFMEFWNEPTHENFQKAHTYLLNEVQEDNIAYYYLYHMHERQAQEHLNTIIENIEEFPQGVKFQVANTLLGKGKYDEAIQIYEKLNIASPEWSCPWRHKGEAFLKQNDYQNAENALVKAIETRDTHYDAYLMLAETYHLQHKNELALQTIEKAFEVLGTDTEDPEEVYSDEQTKFMFWEILKANNDQRATTIEEELRTNYPNKF